MASQGYPSAPPVYHSPHQHHQQAVHHSPYPVAAAYPVANPYTAPPPALNPHFQVHHHPSQNHAQNFVPLEDEPQTTNLYTGPQSHDQYMQPAQGMPVMHHQQGSRIKQFIARPFQQMPFVQSLGTSSHGVPAHQGAVVIQQPIAPEKGPLMWQFRVAIIIFMLMYRGIDFFVQKGHINGHNNDDDDHGLATVWFGFSGFIAICIVIVALAVTYVYPWLAVLQGLAVVVFFATQQFTLLWMMVFFYVTTLGMQLTHVISARWIEGRWKFWPMFKPHYGSICIDAFLAPVTFFWCGQVISQGRMGSLWGWKLSQGNWWGQTYPLILLSLLFYAAILGSICVVHAAVGHFTRQRELQRRGQMPMV